MKKTKSSCESPKIEGPYKSMRLENPKKCWKEGAKESTWIIHYECQVCDFYRNW